MVDFAIKILPNSMCELSEGKIYASVNIQMTLDIMAETILNVTYTTSEIEINLFSDSGLIKGNVDKMELGRIGTTYVNAMGLTKAEF